MAGESYFKTLKQILQNYNPVPNAEDFHNAHQSHRGLKGGVGAGKTYTLAADDILVSYLNAPHCHLSTSPSFDNAHVTVLPALIELCEKNGLEYKWLISKNLFRIIHNNGRKNKIANILILGTDKPHFMKGINAASGSMNEPFSQKKEAFKIWWERIRVKSVRLSRAWAGTAEPDKMQWGWEFFDEVQKLSDDLYTDTISTYDNDNLPKEYVKGLEEIYDDKMREVYMLGKCINLTTGKAYYAFDKSINVINKQPDTIVKNGLQVIISFDFNVNPMCAVEIIFDRIDNFGASPVYFQIRDYKISSSRTDELCDLIIDNIKTKYNFKTTSFIITGDATGSKSSTRNEYNDYDIIMEKFGGIFI
ncbi:MAG: phage terminase large subunit [Chlorobi bacterium]|nr:phage terminase large subunit [Chlorobiota bacterium]MCI0715678.1 phage terminase large subunit [Chlorobiota bacterium]